MKQPPSPFYLHPNQWTDLLCITPLPQPSFPPSFNSIRAVVDISTNLSQFHFPLQLYNGFLNVRKTIPLPARIALTLVVARACQWSDEWRYSAEWERSIRIVNHQYSDQYRPNCEIRSNELQSNRYPNRSLRIHDFPREYSTGFDGIVRCKSNESEDQK